jgi:hypothetical protein
MVLLFLGISVLTKQTKKVMLLLRMAVVVVYRNVSTLLAALGHQQTNLS